MERQPREVLTPLAASFLFGKSGEAVRRATAEGHVISPVELQFSERPIRLIDLHSALGYWHRTRPAHLAKVEATKLEAALADMRLYGITFFGQVGSFADGSVSDDPLTYYRVLHPLPLVVRGAA